MIALLVFSYKNAYSARYLQKTVFLGCQTPVKKKAVDENCGIFSMFFQTPIYTTFSNQTFARMVCTFFSLFAYTNMKPWNLRFKLCVSILITENILKITLYCSF